MTSRPPQATRPLARLLPGRRAWWLIGGAFAAGLLLFLIVWYGKRDEFDFYRAEPSPRSVEGQVLEPLPAPLPAGEDASEFDPTAPTGTSAGRIEPAAGTAAPGSDETVPGVSSGTSLPPSPGAIGDATSPRVLSAPAPDYPRAALRAGASGDVVLRIEVDAQGRPASVEVERGSRHRALDRAAVQAVRGWRFEPAMRDGQPVAGTVQQTIRFDPPR